MLLTSPPTKKSKYPHGASGFLSGEEGEMINSGRGIPYVYSYTTVPAGIMNLGLTTQPDSLEKTLPSLTSLVLFPVCEESRLR